MAKKSNSDCVSPRQAWLRSKYRQGIYHRQHWQDANGDRNPIRKVERFPWLSDVFENHHDWQEGEEIACESGEDCIKALAKDMRNTVVLACKRRAWSQQNTLRLNNLPNQYTVTVITKHRYRKELLRGP